MRNLQRWLPLGGAAALALSVILGAFGFSDVAGILGTAAGVMGVPQDFVAELAKLPAALAVIAGVVLKFKSMYQKAREEDEYIRGKLGE